jgi:hypothetical protein
VFRFEEPEKAMELLSQTDVKVVAESDIKGI